MIVAATLNLVNILFILIRNVVLFTMNIIIVFMENQRHYMRTSSEYNMEEIKDRIRNTMYSNKDIKNRWPLIFVMLSDKEYEKDIWNEYERAKRNGFTFNGLGEEQKIIFIKLCINNGYENILIKIMKEKNWWINNYYEFYSFLNEIKNESIMNIFMENENFKEHVKRYNRKYEKRLNKEGIIVGKSEKKDECVICLEEIDGYYIECKNCKTKIDNHCYKKYLLNNNYQNNCCLCRKKNIFYLSKDSMKKYIEYKEIE